MGDGGFVDAEATTPYDVTSRETADLGADDGTTVAVTQVAGDFTTDQGGGIVVNATNLSANSSLPGGGGEEAAADKESSSGSQPVFAQLGILLAVLVVLSVLLTFLCRWIIKRSPHRRKRRPVTRDEREVEGPPVRFPDAGRHPLPEKLSEEEAELKPLRSDESEKISLEKGGGGENEDQDGRRLLLDDSSPPIRIASVASHQEQHADDKKT